MTKHNKYLERNLLTAICVIAPILHLRFLSPVGRCISLLFRRFIRNSFGPDGSQPRNKYAARSCHHKQALKSIPRNLPACHHFTTPDCCLLASVSVEMSRIQTHLLERAFPPGDYPYLDEQKEKSHTPDRPPQHERDSCPSKNAKQPTAM